MPQLRVDVWSDIACPWCYVGKRRLAAALARFPHREHVTVVARSFELDPGAARSAASDVPIAARLARKYGRSLAEAQRMLQQMTATAAADGIDMRFDRLRPGNTFDAHRLLHLAAADGRQAALEERLFAAYFHEGAAVDDREVLVRLAVDAGLAADDARHALESGAHARDVRGDEEEARRLGITGVPFFVLAGRLGVSGAQPPDALLAALAAAWAEVEAGAPAAGEACGPDGCA